MDRVVVTITFVSFTETTGDLSSYCHSILHSSSLRMVPSAVSRMDTTSDMAGRFLPCGDRQRKAVSATSCRASICRGVSSGSGRLSSTSSRFPFSMIGSANPTRVIGWFSCPLMFQLLGATGGLPVSASSITTPKLYTSLAGHTRPVRLYSGSMYPGTPTTSTSCVSPGDVTVSTSQTATPKPDRRGIQDASRRMPDELILRWMICGTATWCR